MSNSPWKRTDYGKKKRQAVLKKAHKMYPSQQGAVIFKVGQLGLGVQYDLCPAKPLELSQCW